MNKELFNNKNILIFLPHQDDEINTVYGLLDDIRKIAKSIKVVYSTNGDSVVDAKYRLKEAIDSLKLVGIPKKNIIFMGYADQIPEADNHMYHEDIEWVGVNGKRFTNTPYLNDYHFLKTGEHAIFSRTNLVRDIYCILNEEMADILFCIDFDSHPDHRALSLCFEAALGQLLKRKKYTPLVYKMFAYPTSYKGDKDFSFNNDSTKFICENNSISDLQNPYYNWEERIRIKQSKKAFNYFLLANIYFKGALKHKSQYIFNKIKQIINSDMIFFERQTANCLNVANIQVSSGDAKYLNDFMLFDTSDITGGDVKVPELDCGYTIFSKQDKEKKVSLNFNEKTTFNAITIYLHESNKDSIDYIKVIVGGEEKKYFGKCINNKYIVTDLKYIDVIDVEIKIVLKTNGDLMVSELELLNNKVNTKWAYLLINGNVIDTYYYNKRPEITIYTSYGADGLTIEEIPLGQDSTILLKDKTGMIIDKAILKKLTWQRKIYLKIIELLNALMIFIGRVYQKIIRIVRNCF